MTETKAKSQRKMRNVGELIFYICLIALPLLQVAIFYIVVNFNSILMIFQDYVTVTDNGKAGGFVTDIRFFIDNVKEVWRNIKNYQLIYGAKNAFVVWFWSAIVGRLLSILFSYYIYKKWPFGKTFKFFLFLPSILPGILLVLMFKFFTNEALTEVMKMLLDKPVTPLLARADTRLPTIIFFNIWASFGTQVLIYTGTMDQIAPEIIEAGEMDGVNAFQEFVFLIIPMIMPTVATFLMTSVATIFTNQASLYSFFSENVPAEDSTLGYIMYVLIHKPGARDNYPYASTLGVLCTLVSLPLTLIVRKLLMGKED